MTLSLNNCYDFEIYEIVFFSKFVEGPLLLEIIKASVRVCVRARARLADFCAQALKIHVKAAFAFINLY